MPQTWLVVCCHACGKFQVDQEKKVKKWQCKVCGEKQSLQRIYARSHSAKDCRQVVQKYNSARGEVEAEDTERALQQAYAEAEDGYDEDAACAAGDAAGGWLGEDVLQQQLDQQGQLAGTARPGRWLEYAEEGEDEDGRCTVAVPERAVKQKRGGGAGSGQQGGGKRQRQQEQDQEPRWGREEIGGSSAGWPAAEQQQQQHCQQHQRQPQRPLGNQNGPAPPGGHGFSWQGGQQHKSCGQQVGQQEGWQPQPAQQQQHRHRQQAQQRTQQSVLAGGGAQRAQPLQARWQQESGRPQQFQEQSAAAQQQKQAAPRAASASRWGGFVEGDDW